MLQSCLCLLVTSKLRCPSRVPAQVGDDEEEVRLAQAQVLMDCLADLLAQKGLDGSRAWCEGGLKLKLRSSEEGITAWVVVGQLPPEEGQGTFLPALSSCMLRLCADDGVSSICHA